MNTIVDEFLSACYAKFQFLTSEYGIRRSKTLYSGLSKVTYKNTFVAVVINLEWREQNIYVEIYRVIDGKLDLDAGGKLGTNFTLNSLLAVRKKDYVRATRLRPVAFDGDDVEVTLTRMADDLKEYAADVLRGDFSVAQAVLDYIAKHR
ncbi:MAG: hypothetical protein ACLQVD_20880 [Capsulimonadaceae bacterium]